VAGAFFMEILDGTIIAPAAPHIAADFGVGAVDINIAITAYVLTLAVLIPVSGWLADRFGARRVFTAALVVFTLASALCAGAPSLAVLTAARVLQGVGGAMMVPVGRLVVLRTTAKTDLVRAIAYLTWPALTAPVVAPVVGGVLSEYASWRWIFLINVPLGLAALLLARRLVPDLRSGDAGRLDRTGFALTAVGVGALVVGMEGLGAGEPRWAGAGGGAECAQAAAPRRIRSARAFLRAPLLRCSAPRLTALSTSETSLRCSASACASSPASTAAARRRKYVLTCDVYWRFSKRSRCERALRLI
jgi:MFS family permease